MDKQHPHFGATYKISRQRDGSFAVEVVFSAGPRVNVKGFASEALAETIESLCASHGAAFGQSQNNP
jgi:hypothetical protein